MTMRGGTWRGSSFLAVFLVLLVLLVFLVLLAVLLMLLVLLVLLAAITITSHIEPLSQPRSTQLVDIVCAFASAFVKRTGCLCDHTVAHPIHFWCHRLYAGNTR